MAAGWRGQYYKYKSYSLNLLAMYKQRADLQAFLEIILSLSTVIVFVLFAIKPTALTIISLTQEIKNKRETLANLNQKITDLQTANNVFIQNQNVIPNIEASIFSLPEPNSISKQVLGLGVKNNVTITDITIDETPIIGNIPAQANSRASTDIKPLPEGAGSMPVRVNIEGEYSGLISFIKDLEFLRIPVKIDTLTFKNTETESGQKLIETVHGRIPFVGKNN